jgi:type II secretory ATPase GspE/PulE/Tfp pilus assembly ATPase PilB-like protein
LGADPALIASSLRCILAQRLGRRICPNCKEPVSYSPAEVPGIPPELQHETLKVFRGKGCRNCFNTGYRGRTVFAEAFEINDPIRELIVDRRPAPVIRRAAAEAGMVRLYDDAIYKMLEGVTTLEEILQHADF